MEYAIHAHAQDCPFWLDSARRLLAAAPGREWLPRAAGGGTKSVLSMALADPDFQPLWPELAGR